MDIVAKHIPADENGVRIAELDEMSYRRQLWEHTPMTDFWRFGPGITKRLVKLGVNNLGELARLSVRNEDVLYREFGKNAELIIDHAWGYEPCTMADIKAYRPSDNSLSSGQVLSCPYTFDKARIIVREMADLLSMDLVEKRLVTDQITLYVGYDSESLSSANQYKGEVSADWYGKAVPKPAHGSFNLPRQSSSSMLIADSAVELFDRIVNPSLLVRRVNIGVCHLVDESKASGVQLNLFEEDTTDYSRERKQQEAILAIRKKFGKNAILKGLDFEEGATTRERNNQIGGHKA